MDNLEIDYKKAAQQLRSGEALFGKDGALYITITASPLFYK